MDSQIEPELDDELLEERDYFLALRLRLLSLRLFSGFSFLTFILGGALNIINL
jgi:hypothetical protein